MASDAIFGLAGVVVGGVLTGGVDLVLERRRERRKGESCARMVGDGLSSASSFIEASIAQRAWLGNPAAVLSVDLWREQRSSLAAAPGFDGWYPVAGAWGYIEQIGHFAGLTGEGVGDDPFENREPDFYWIGLMMIGIAEKALDGYAQTGTYADPPEEEPTELQSRLKGLFEHAAKKGDGDS
jgi:hypothetical protein